MEASLSSYIFRKFLLSLSVARFSIPFVLKFCDSLVICDCYCCCLVVCLCPTLCDPMNCSPPGSSVCGISQARILEWVAIPFSRGSSGPRDRTHVSCIAGRFFTIWATREAPFFHSEYVLNMLSESLMGDQNDPLTPEPSHKASPY